MLWLSACMLGASVSLGVAGTSPAHHQPNHPVVREHHVPEGHLTEGGEQCAKGRDHSEMELYCPHSVIESVHYAFFGNPHGSCPEFKAGVCNAKGTLGIIRATCVGKGICNGKITDQDMSTGGYEPFNQTVWNNTIKAFFRTESKATLDEKEGEARDNINQFCMLQPMARSLFVSYQCKAVQTAAPGSMTTKDGVTTVPCCSECMDGCGGASADDCHRSGHKGSLGDLYGLCDCYGCADDHGICAHVDKCPTGGRVPFFAHGALPKEFKKEIANHHEIATQLCSSKMSNSKCNEIDRLCEWKNAVCKAKAIPGDGQHDAKDPHTHHVGTQDSPHLTDPCAGLSHNDCTPPSKLSAKCEWVPADPAHPAIDAHCAYDSETLAEALHLDVDTDVFQVRYMGCYQAVHQDEEDTAPDYDFEVYKGIIKQNSPKACHHKCGYEYPYIALRGVHCACSVEPPHFVSLPLSECNEYCKGSKDEKCGAAQINSVYRVGAPEPVFPGDFRLFAPKDDIPEAKWRCIPVNDPVNSDLVGFNWCQSRRTRWIGWDFSPSGAKSGMDCIHMHTDFSQNMGLSVELLELQIADESDQALELDQWEGEWLCVRKDEPLFLELDWFADSSVDRLPFPASNCVNWGQDVGAEGEPINHTQFLCQVPVEPRWPNDFRWSGEGKVSDFNCISVEETGGILSEGNTDDNFWCQRMGTRWLGWTYGPLIDGMSCTQLSEKKTWKHQDIFFYLTILDDTGTYLCLYEGSVIGETLKWHGDERPAPGGFSKNECVQWSEFNSADSTDNYMCAKPSISAASNALKSMQMDCRAGTTRECSCVDQKATELDRDSDQGTLEKFYNDYMSSYEAEDLVGTQECTSYLNYVSVWDDVCSCPSIQDEPAPAVEYRMALAALLAVAACCCCNAILACALFGTALKNKREKDSMMKHEEEVESMISGSESKKPAVSTADYLNEVAVDAVKKGGSVARSIELAITGN